MSKLKARFEQLQTEQAALREKFQKQAQELFKETFKEFFELNPDVTAVIWTQYTPYFNDGEECVFGVNSPTFTNAPEVELENVSSWGEYEGEDETVWAVDNPKWAMESGREYYKDTAELMQKSKIDLDSMELLSKMIQSTEMQDVMLAMFDNHVTVTATRNGFDVDEYDHD
jgi:hypothetical protein